MEEKYNQYDKLLTEYLANLYLFGNDAQAIRLCNFDPDNKGHLLILKLGFMLHYNFEYKVNINTKLTTYCKLVVKFKCNDWLKRKKEGAILDCQDFLDFFETRDEHPGLFAEIYDAYYGGKDD